VRKRQVATLAGLKPSGGHFNSGRRDLRAGGYVIEANGLVAPTPDGLKAAGEVPPAPSTPAERLALWCGRLPAPAPEMLRTLAAQGERYTRAPHLAAISELHVRNSRDIAMRLGSALSLVTGNSRLGSAAKQRFAVCSSASSGLSLLALAKRQAHKIGLRYM